MIVCTDNRLDPQKTTVLGGPQGKSARHKAFCTSAFGRQLAARALMQRVLAGRSLAALGATAVLNEKDPWVVGPTYPARDFDPPQNQNPELPPNPQDPKSWRIGRLEKASNPIVGIFAFTCANEPQFRILQKRRKKHRKLKWELDGGAALGIPGQSAQRVFDFRRANRASQPPGFGPEWCFVALPDTPDGTAVRRWEWRFEGEVNWSKGTPLDCDDHAEVQIVMAVDRWASKITGGNSRIVYK